ncbi:hypothetical protein BDN72DRAFT_783503 [Pluteus cervinus]|uniref:Uncharacterized protein n=1 Tax=Pluteus cervinus TaxID=181527 RepID=A0ACD3BG91_9AGAR|nr:hypothetical protein BDN72DRAFT_783503 [Pluteus cervinus]
MQTKSDCSAPSLALDLSVLDHSWRDSIASLFLQADKPLPPLPQESETSGMGVGGRLNLPVKRDSEEHRSSWLDSDSDGDDVNLKYLRDPPSARFPSSPFTPSTSRPPRAATPPPASPPDNDDTWAPPPITRFLSPLLSLGDNTLCSPLPSNTPPVTAPSPLTRSASTTEASFKRNLALHSILRPSMSALPLVDPSQYPDPYPFRSPPRNLSSTPPSLSSGGSSTASTRSSAYTSSGSTSGDYGHVHVESGDNETPPGVGSDSAVQMLANDVPSISSRNLPSRPPIDSSRWSGAYSSPRSRSSSIGNGAPNGNHANGAPKLHERSSYETGWPVDERDETILSEDETDDENLFVDPDRDLEEKEEERTSAVVIAEEGRGLIVQGEGLPINLLNTQTGTTHLLIGSSSTPNGMPAYLTTTLPQIGSTILALDISANFLGALPPVLAVCLNLEELNIANNPLRVLPMFLAALTNLRVLIADNTGIATLPDSLADLERLHTLSVRRNKMYALPSWLCLLPVLQTLCVEGNPFQGPWKDLVEPLLAKAPMTPMYPPSTPVFPLPSAVSHNGFLDGDGEATDIEEDTDFSNSVSNDNQPLPQDEEDQTIRPQVATVLGRSVTSPYPANPPPPLPTTQARGLTRTRTTPNRAYFNQSRVKSSAPNVEVNAIQASQSTKGGDGARGDREIRKMKSAGELRRGRSAAATSGESTPPRPPLAHYPTSHSSTNLVVGPSAPESPPGAKRFASLSAAATARAANPSRPQLTQSLWNSISENDNDPGPSRMSVAQGKQPISYPGSPLPGQDVSRHRSGKEGKEKSGRWGFLKKMSMGKMKIDAPPTPVTPGTRGVPQPRPNITLGPPAVPTVGDLSPTIDVRFSTTGTLGPLSLHGPTLHTPSSPPKLEMKPSRDLLKVTLAPSSNLLAPPSPQPRSAKRRSFLPINDAPATLSIPIPDPTPFVPGVIAQNEADDLDGRTLTPSPITDSYQHLRREEERAREAYLRAFRSVMAYLKDMNDLNLPQSNTLSIYAQDEPIPPRSRRPTGVDGTREMSMVSTGTGSSDTPAHLRSPDSMGRSGGPSQTLSVATTDSSGSSEERKYKDDKSKRAMVVKEIVVTERTYVKGLQELVDIYIKPGSEPANLLSNVGSARDTIVPAAERKIVYGGLESLFSFHKDSFLPALEVAAAPLMKAPTELAESDGDGQLSLDVVRAVAGIFLKHAAFMKMYSTYINNFDNSVQRVKAWSTDRSNGAVTPSSAVSPTSSTAQLVGLGLSMSAISNPGVAPDGSSNNGPSLSASQRRRIKAYLKRCRHNPRHSQLNLEGYLLLPVQRIPRYRLLLEELLRSTPPAFEYMEDPLDRALAEISSLAANMNEGKRESESRRKLVIWQARIRRKFPSPLVQPHRRLIMDGPLLLTRVVRKATVNCENINSQGDASTLQVDCLTTETTPRQLIGILCNDLLVLCRDPSDGQDPNCLVDLWAVLRMQTLPQPASIVHGNALRLVDNKAVLYFDTPTPSDALNWYRAINLHIPTSKT